MLNIFFVTLAFMIGAAFAHYTVRNAKHVQCLLDLTNENSLRISNLKNLLAKSLSGSVTAELVKDPAIRQAAAQAAQGAHSQPPGISPAAPRCFPFRKPAQYNLAVFGPRLPVEKIMLLLSQGHSDAEVASIVGTTPGMSQRIRRRLGSCANHWKRIDAWKKKHPNAIIPPLYVNKVKP